MTADDHWLDPVAVGRAVAGREVGRELTFPEIVAVARVLVPDKLSINGVAERYRCRPSRLRAALDLP